MKNAIQSRYPVAPSQEPSSVMKPAERPMSEWTSADVEAWAHERRQNPVTLAAPPRLISRGDDSVMLTVQVTATQARMLLGLLDARDDEFFHDAAEALRFALRNA